MQSQTLPLTAPAVPKLKTNAPKAKILKGIAWVLNSILFPHLVFLLIVTVLVGIACISVGLPQKQGGRSYRLSSDVGFQIS